MQLTKLGFSNFKNWKHFDTDLTKINLFFGQNSSGKSSIIQLLLLLKQTVEHRDDKIVLYFGDDRSYVDFGNFDEIINRDAKIKEFGFNISSNFLNNYNFYGNFSKNKKGITKLKRFKASDSNYSYSVIENEDDYKVSIKNELSEVHNNEFELKSINNFYKIPFIPYFSDITSINEVENHKQTVKKISFIQDAFSLLFLKIIYIGPLREFPRREYKWTGSRHSNFGIRGENTFDAIITTFKESQTFESKHHKFNGSLAKIVCKWLIEFDMADDFQIIPISEEKQLYQVNVKTKGSHNWVDICDVGFGVSQILPIIALCYYAPKGSIIIIEQPEIHLHPKVQSGIGDLLIDAANSNNIQFIIESHSEHLLTRIQRRIAEEVIDDKDVKINFCKLSDGESTLEELVVNDYGEIQNWPENFFGDEMEEIYQMQNAILDRKMKNDAK